MERHTSWAPDGAGSDGSCPVLSNPEPDCYCMNLTSLTIPRAIRYCLRDFRDCPIYKRAGTAQDDTEESSCPILDNLQPDCYCKNMTSLVIPSVVRFCLQDFKVCPIYKRYMGIDT